MYACVCVCNDQEELPGNKGWREEEKKNKQKHKWKASEKGERDLRKSELD